MSKEEDKKIFLFLFLMLIVCGSVFCQDTMKSRLLDSVVVKGKKIDVLEQAPSGDKINERQLQTINSQSIGEAVRFLSGVNVKDYGGMGGIKTVSVRGLSSNHTSVLYDGVSLFDNQSGQIDLSKYSLYSVSSLALANSQFTPLMPTATSLSSANSINIETKKPDFSLKEKIKEELSVGYGSFNLFNVNNYFASRIKDKDVFVVFFDMMNTDGKYPYKLHYGQSQNYQTQRLTRQNNDLFSSHLETNYFHTFNDKNSLNVKLYYYYSNRGLPSSVTLYYQNSAQRLWNRNIFFQTSYLSKINKNLSYKNNIKIDYNYTRYKDPHVFTITNGVDDKYTQMFYYMNNAFSYKLKDNLFFTLTNDLSFNNLSSSSSLEDNPQRVSSVTALVVDWKVKDFYITADIIHNFSKDFYNNIDNNAKNYFSPFISLKYEKGKYKTCLFYKNIFRLPTFNELYYRQIGNKNLQPEKTNQVSWSNSYEFLFNDFTVIPTIDLYYNDVKDKIVAIPQNNVFLWSMLNYGKVKIEGVDFKLYINTFLFNKINIDLKLNYSYQKVVDDEKNSLTYKEILPYMPKNVFSSILTVVYKNITFGYTAFFVDKRYALSENIESNKLSAYSEHNINLSYKWEMNNKKCISNVDFMISLNNIFNTQYEVVKSYPMIGRNYDFKIKISF